MLWNVERKGEQETFSSFFRVQESDFESWMGERESCS
jgi:hypothetical protein